MSCTPGTQGLTWTERAAREKVTSYRVGWSQGGQSGGERNISEGHWNRLSKRPCRRNSALPKEGKSVRER
jgi:hypothetical protein